jgi:hypothetical protein
MSYAFSRFLKLNHCFANKHLASQTISTKILVLTLETSSKISHLKKTPHTEHQTSFEHHTSITKIPRLLDFGWGT